MIPLAQAIPQVLRFSGCPGWPATKEGQDELAQTMAEISTDPAHAERIADAWLHASFWAPTPFNLIQAARGAAEPVLAPTGPPCSECDGSGWIVLPERQVHRGLPGCKYASVDPCICRGSGP